MFESNPYASNNGLHVTDRTSQSITLAWPSPKPKLIISENGGNGSEGPTTPEKDKAIQADNQSVAVNVNEEGVGVNVDISINWNSDDNWFEIEMAKENQSPPVWISIYKGYGWEFTMDGLSPDSGFIFRMKRNKENEWGTEVVGSTDPSPASTEDLNRAVEMNSEYLITRILELTRPSHLNKILRGRDRNGMTTLMVACHTGNVSIAEKLIGAGSDINAQSSHVYRTPLIFATIMGREHIALLLDKHGVDWTIKDKGGCNAFDYAINAGNLNLLKLAYTRLGRQTIHNMSMNGWKPLMRAVVQSNNLEVVRFLIRKGADPNTTDEKNSKSVLMAAILAKKGNFVKFLLRAGANPLYENENGKSCLKVARGLEYREMTELILKSCEQANSSHPSISK